MYDETYDEDAECGKSTNFIGTPPQQISRANNGGRSLFNPPEVASEFTECVEPTYLKEDAGASVDFATKVRAHLLTGDSALDVHAFKRFEVESEIVEPTLTPRRIEIEESDSLFFSNLGFQKDVQNLRVDQAETQDDEDSQVFHFELGDSLPYQRLQSIFRAGWACGVTSPLGDVANDGLFRENRSPLISSDAVASLRHASALLIDELTSVAAVRTQRRGKKVITYEDVCNAVSILERFDFVLAGSVLPHSVNTLQASVNNAAKGPSDSLL